MRYGIKSLLWIATLIATSAAAFGGMALVVTPWVMYTWMVLRANPGQGRHYPRLDFVLIWVLVFGTMGLFVAWNLHTLRSTASDDGRFISALAFAVCAFAPAFVEQDRSE
ncbi:MAG: hypothetical protein AAGJ46_21325 [Planctomycetota bacterium]